MGRRKTNVHHIEILNIMQIKRRDDSVVVVSLFLDTKINKMKIIAHGVSDKPSYGDEQVDRPNSQTSN